MFASGRSQTRIWGVTKMNLSVLIKFVNFDVTRVFEEFVGFRDFKIEERDF